MVLLLLMVSGRSPHTYVKFTAFAAAVEPLHLNEESFIYADATQVASWGQEQGTRWARGGQKLQLGLRRDALLTFSI